ncbi:unnamed protein product [Pseudo-nitzschia multistriata]|uniref:AB hydrolase-1 domain-containing protein n=1 Tax=Pseudo-nitzschia multistriata TaxID=183589 RepID=A0A448ZFK0_9STRA|nr:unnamed protein product [Pseudo-nitzschia multistriata]
MASRFLKRRFTTNLLGWPTDVTSVDPNPASCHNATVHTIIVWIPGNPGQYDWYNSDFLEILSALGHGYAIRSLSHAGHGLMVSIGENCGADHSSSTMDIEGHCHRCRADNEETNGPSPRIPWTVKGQVLHKIAFVDSLLREITGGDRYSEHERKQTCRFTPNPRFIFIGHSFGCHIIQRMCVLRPDILERTTGFLFLMPYIRTKPLFVTEKKKLDVGGSYPEHLILVATKLSQLLKFFPEPIVRGLIRKGLQGDSSGNDDGGIDGESIANVTTKLLCNPLYPRNFFELGTEEIRDIPNEIDTTALRLLSSRKLLLPQNKTSMGTGSQRDVAQKRRIFILYAGDNDQWCPSFHGEEINALQSVKVLPASIERTKMSGLRHDYVCQDPAARSRVNNWCISNILKMTSDSTRAHANKLSRTPDVLSSKL